jgi:hypothetical protein
MGWAAAVPYAMEAISWGLSKTGKKSSSLTGQKGTPEKVNKLSNYTHGQRKLLDYITKHPEIDMPDINQNQMFQQGQNYTSNILSQDPYDQNFLQQFQQPYIREFEEQTVPELAQRFGSLGAQRSSAFAQSLGAAKAGLLEKLASIAGEIGMGRQRMGQQAANQAFNYAQLPFNQEYERQGLNLNRQQLALGAQPFQYHITPAQSGTPGYAQAGMNAGAQGILNDFSNGGQGASSLWSKFTDMFGGGQSRQIPIGQNPFA